MKGELLKHFALVNTCLISMFHQVSVSCVYFQIGLGLQRNKCMWANFVVIYSGLYDIMAG